MLDPTTLAAYAAGANAAARAQAVRDSLGSGTLTVELRDGETLVYSGTFAGPMTAGEDGSLSADVLLSGLVTTGGTPDAATWTCRIRNADGRHIEGSFGPGGRFTWSGGTLVVGQAVRLRVTIAAASGVEMAVSQVYEDFAEYDAGAPFSLESINGSVSAEVIANGQFRSGKALGLTGFGSPRPFSIPGFRPGMTQLEVLYHAEVSTGGSRIMCSPVSVGGAVTYIAAGYDAGSGTRTLVRRALSGSQSTITESPRSAGARYLTRTRFTFADGVWQIKARVWAAPGSWTDAHLAAEPETWDVDFDYKPESAGLMPGGLPVFCTIATGGSVGPTNTRLLWYGIGFDGASAPSGPVAGQPVSRPVSAPAITGVTPETPTRIAMEWTRPAGATGSRVRVDDGEWIDKADLSHHTFGGLEPGVSHTLYVCGYNSAGNGPAASASQTTPTGYEEPLHFAWHGAVTASGFTVVAEAAATASLTLDVATDAAFAEIVSTQTEPEATAGAPVKFAVSGLDPQTVHYWRVKTADQTISGRCKTFPAGAANLLIAVSCCAGNKVPESVSNNRVFADIAALEPTLFVHQGDMHYRDRCTAQDFRDVNAQPNQSRLYRTVPLAYVWDDHDYSANNSGSGVGNRGTALTTYRAYTPHYPLLDGPANDTPIMQDFVIGRLRFVLLDSRSSRGGGAIIGAQQMARLMTIFDELEADETSGLVLCTVVPWISASMGDTWSDAPAERAAIANGIDSRGLTGRTLMIAGDMHGIAIDNGTNNTYADNWPPGPPVFQAGSLDCFNSTKGGPYSHGRRGGDRQFGLIEVVDGGGEEINVTLRAIHMDGAIWKERISYTFAMTVAGA